MQKYSIRDSQGKFVKLALSTPKHSCKCRNGNCCGAKIVAGRLYSWRGITVRAFGKVGFERLVAAHKGLMGCVAEADLKPISQEEVQKYLAQA